MGDRVRTGDCVTYKGQQYYAKANGTSVRLYNHKEDIGDHSKQVFAPATKNVQHMPEYKAHTLVHNSAPRWHVEPLPAVYHPHHQPAVTSQPVAYAPPAMPLHTDSVASIPMRQHQFEAARFPATQMQPCSVQHTPPNMRSQDTQGHASPAVSSSNFSSLASAGTVRPPTECSRLPLPTISSSSSQAHRSSSGVPVVSIHLADLVYPSEPVAVGAFGKVYRTVHRPTGQILAAKQRKVTDCELHDEDKQDFLREAAILASLHHPNVVHFVGKSLAATGEIVLLTEWMEGGSLRTWLYNRPTFTFPRQQCLCLALDLAHGLAYLHERQILHRDIKPDNVLLDSYGRTAKICDMGLAKLRSAASYYANEPVGTIMYMAPEILQNGKYSTAADVYAFGLVMGEIYSAKTPYPYKWAANIESMRQEVGVKGVRPTIDVSTPQPVASLIAWCWGPHPSSRPNMSAVCEELESLLT